MKNIWTMLMTFSSVFLTGAIAFAADSTAIALASKGATSIGWGIPVGISLGIGMAVLGAAMGQGRVAATALEGISRNPNASDKVFVPMLLGLAFIESLVLFAWVLLLFIQQTM